METGDYQNERATRVKSMFGDIANRYDLLNTIMSAGRDRSWRRVTISKANLPSGGIALDVATGTGELAFELATQSSGGNIVAMDFCAEMLERARDNQNGTGERTSFVLGDALRLPFPNNVFDCVTIGFGLRNMTSVPEAFREMTRVTKPGGRVVSLELTRPKSRIMSVAHRLYLSCVMPVLGTLIAGNREAYTYLPDTILKFPSPEEIKLIMKEAGLSQIEIHPLTLGVVTVQVGTKCSEGV